MKKNHLTITAKRERTIGDRRFNRGDSGAPYVNAESRTPYALIRLLFRHSVEYTELLGRSRCLEKSYLESAPKSGIDWKLAVHGEDRPIPWYSCE